MEPETDALEDDIPFPGQAFFVSSVVKHFAPLKSLWIERMIGIN